MTTFADRSLSRINRAFFSGLMLGTGFGILLASAFVRWVH